MPSPSEVVQALIHWPQTSAPPLRGAIPLDVRFNPMTFPSPKRPPWRSCGRYAIVFQLLFGHNNPTPMILRLYHTQWLPSADQRYAAITRWVWQCPPALRGVFVGTWYYHQGAHIGFTGVSGQKQSEWFPALIMERANGASLEEHLRVLDTLEPAERDWRFRRLTVNVLNLADRMQEMGVAHGDISFDNLFIDNDDNIHLVDYDSLWIRGLDLPPSPIVGQPEFQHPDVIAGRAKWPRKPDRGAVGDSFAFVVLLLLLTLHRVDPAFWRAVGRAKPSFSTRDFERTSLYQRRSELLRLMGHPHAGVRRLAGILVKGCNEHLATCLPLSQLVLPDLREAIDRSPPPRVEAQHRHQFAHYGRGNPPPPPPPR
jgi:serine/threonine protein kinase